MIMKCPCDNCVCVPICRHRTIKELKINCKIVDRYYSYPHFVHRLMDMRESLNPTNPDWSKGYD